MAIDADALMEEIASAVTEPQSATNDAGSVTMPNLFNAFEVARKLKAEQARAEGKVGVTFRQMTFGSSRIT